MKNNTEDLEKDIVSFEQAKELHSLGWNTATLCGYEIETGELYNCQNYKKDGLYKPEKDLFAPTKSQVFRWFREKYNYIPHIYKYQDLNKYDFDLYGGLLDLYDEYSLGDDVFDTYEEAEDACIYKLIELAKQQDK